MITGAAGSIGSELTRQIIRLNPSKIYLLDQEETGVFDLYEEFDVFHKFKDIIPIIADIREEERIAEIFKKYRPNIVFHAAAYKHVPLMEIFPDEAIKTNILGTINLLSAANEYRVRKFIFISTDKVTGASTMGWTKKIGEDICQLCGGIVVRFGNVLASRGSVIPIWREQIKKGILEITDKKMARYFMTIFEACELVIEVTQMGKEGDKFIFDMGEPIKVTDLANQFIRLSGQDARIKFIGIRPGERLFEKLTIKGEKLIPTKHKKIFKIV